jgi:hypothetical protein
MTKLKILLALCISSTVVMLSCKSKQTVTQHRSDNMYFMASDIVQSDPFNSYGEFTQENFSERNVNPEYIARYQTEVNNTQETESRSNIHVYNNYSGGFNPVIGDFYPFGLGIYDPFWGWGFRPNVFIGGGFGFMHTRLIGSNFGFVNFYDPFFNPFFLVFRPGWNSFYSGFNWSSDIYSRQTVRRVRPTRGSSLGISNERQVNTLATPAGARSVARKNVLHRTANQILPESNTREDFKSSQNDYYNSARPTTPSRRNAQTTTVNRESNRNSNQSTTPSYKAITPNTNTSPSRRVSSPSYNRVAPSRNSPTQSTPSRNSGSTNTNSTGTRRGN